MDSAQWKRLDDILQSALDRAPQERDAFLKRACAGDETLEREVRSLLTSEKRAGRFLENPAIEVAARAIAVKQETPEASGFPGDPLRRCPSCGTAASPDSEFCGKCGKPLNGPDSAATMTEYQPHRSTPPSPGNMDEGRFPPGTLLAQRYRVVSLLGRGGMGEVYRANDLLLGQTVALKFMPAQWTSDENTRARFRTEVRIARQISHPNVCRVYDIGDAEGSTWLSMEYVDGEDLASLLRRIGRLPTDKALEVARQLCAGLAAAHDKGVLHRDLKPGNIMLDGQGHLRITDFGLAGLAGEVRDIRSGTPGYMAPEQQSGREVTALSDIYALGVVLHEVFTGKRPFADSAHPEPASELPPGLTPDVDHVIRRCLAEDPAKRPASALQVAAALPEGTQAGDLTATILKEESGLMRKLVGSADTRPYRLWRILHIGMCLRCAVLIYLVWRFKNVTSGRWSVALFFSTLLCSTIQSAMAVVLTFAGNMDTKFVLMEVRRFAPWLCAFGLANSALAIVIAGWIAEGHTILAMMIAIVGVITGVKALTVKPAMDRLAIYESNRR